MIQLWQQGDELAFAFIYKKFSVRLLAVAIQKTGDRQLAQELVQDTFVILLNNKNSLNNLTSLFAYLYITLKNRFLDLHKHNVVHKKYETFINFDFNEADNSTLAWIETNELEKILNEEIEKLPQQCRNVFKLSRKSYLSNKEIAVNMQISENTVEQHMRKALKTLRKSLMVLRSFFF